MLWVCKNPIVPRTPRSFYPLIPEIRIKVGWLTSCCFSQPSASDSENGDDSRAARAPLSKSMTTHP